MAVTYDDMTSALRDSLLGMSVLAGDVVPNGPSMSWQQHAASTAGHLRHLADLLVRAANGDHEPAIVFPSPLENVYPWQ